MSVLPKDLCKETLEKRVNLKIMMMPCLDRDGFSKAHKEEWSAVPVREMEYKGGMEVARAMSFGSIMEGSEGRVGHVWTFRIKEVFG